MAETLVHHNDYLNHIDIKGDKIPDGFNENQIRNKAREYVEKKIQSGISKENLDQLLKEMKQLLERQDIERIDLVAELKQKEIGETKEDINKEALIQEAKTMLYEKLGIQENLKANSPFENFLKGGIDELILGNYELAIDIRNTNGQIIIESIKQLATWEGIKKMAEGLGESIWNLFAGNAYEKGKSAAQLGLLTTVAGVGCAVGRKGVKVGMREVAKFRSHKENIVTSSEVKGVVKETGKKVDEIVPKKQIDFDKLLVEDVKRLGNKERLEAGSFYLKGKKFTPEQERAILKAHETGIPNKNGKFDIGDLRKKYIILEKAGFNDNEIRTLMEKGVCGLETPPLQIIGGTEISNLYPKYPDLEKYNDIFKPNDKIRVLGEGTKGLVLANEKHGFVGKIPIDSEAFPILEGEIKKHRKFYNAIELGRKNEDIPSWVKVPLVKDNIQSKNLILIMEQIDGNSLTSSWYKKHYSNIEGFNKENLSGLTDYEIKLLLEHKYKVNRGELDSMVMDVEYSLEVFHPDKLEGYKKTIDYLGKNGLVHNDLHSGNIIIGKDGNLYIIDFDTSTFTK